jgi:hypothetical protein
MARRRRVLHPGLMAFSLGALVLASACEGDTLYEPTGPDPVDPGEPNGPDPDPGVRLSIVVETGDRIELTDSLRVRLTAYDPTAVSGIQRLGYTLVVTLDDGSRQGRTGEVTFPAGPAGDTVSASFSVAPTWLGSADVPADFELQAYGFAFNRAGDCRAAVPDAPSTDFACASSEVAGQSFRISATRAQRLPILAVAGRTTLFPDRVHHRGGPGGGPGPGERPSLEPPGEPPPGSSARRTTPGPAPWPWAPSPGGST